LLKKSIKTAQESVLSIWSIAILLQVTYFYFFAGLLKSGAEWVSEGSAIYYAFEYDQFATPIAKFLLQFPQLLKVLNFSILALEILSPFLLLTTQNKFRSWAVYLFFSFHIGIALTLNLSLIPYTNMLALVLFLPSSFWKKTKSQVVYQKKNTCLGLVLITYVFAWNLSTLTRWGNAQSWQWPGYILRMDQDWGFFAPRPYKSDGWWIFRGHTKTGATINAWNNEDFSEQRPQNFFSYYGGAHWIAYLILSLDPKNSAHHSLLLDFLCRKNETLTQVAFEYEEEQTPKPGFAPLKNRYILATKTCNNEISN
jgi:hypothetical protein